MKTIQLCFILLFLSSISSAQQAFYDVSSGNGKGIRFWSSDSYKIHMGNSAEYKLGPVTDYSIKFNMSNNTGRGWTWGVIGQTPIAALSNTGILRVQDAFEASKFNVLSGTGNGIRFWNSDDYKMSMGNSSGYKYGPVTDYSIKVNMSNNPGRGWTWGVGGQAPIAALSNTGDMQIEGSLVVMTKIAIGTNTTGSHKLAVDGSIGARKIQVEANGWSDFVFDKNYELSSLEEVEEFVNKNHHLPEIPSESEIIESGINLGEMDAKLLLKIEELTLYLIEQNKEINILKEKVKQMERN